MAKSYTFKEQFRGMPWGQLSVVALMRFAEPISFTSLFPYIYFMVKSFEICPEHEIARYAGYISGAFALCQCATGILWGRMSDKYGRKPIIIMGICGSALSMFSFGFSSNFYMAVGARCIAGLLNGNVGVIRTLLGEIAKKREHQAIAFSIMPLLWQIGCVIGPMVGGYLADPVGSHPEWFDEDTGFIGHSGKTLFEARPFLLPNIVVTGVLLCGAIVAFFFLDETHDIKKYDYDLGRSITKRITRALFRSKPKSESETPVLVEDEETSPLLKGDNRNPSSDSMASQSTMIHPIEEVDQSWKAVLQPSVIKVLISAAFLSGHSVVYEELLPVFFSSRPEKSHLPFKLAGGLGMDSEQVGNYLSLNGFVGIFVMLLVFPWCDTTFGSLKTYRFGLSLFPIIYFAVPYFVLLVGLPSPVVTIVLTVNLFIRTVINAISHPSLLLIANRAPAHTRHLGVVNGCVQVATAFSRAIGPIIWGLLMTFGQQIGYVQLPWWGLAALAGVGMIQGYWISDKDENGVEFYN